MLHYIRPKTCIMKNPLTVNEYENTDELDSVRQELIQVAKEHTKHSYSPYSKFAVGAAILLENGKILGGSNQENASYPLCLCAERTALAAAASIYPNIPIVSIAVTAFADGDFVSDPVSPCGACRQVISENSYRYNRKTEVILYSQNKIIVMESIASLLPLGFEGSSLPK